MRSKYEFQRGKARDLRTGMKYRTVGDNWNTVRKIEPFGNNLKIWATNGAQAVYPEWKALDIRIGE